MLPNGSAAVEVFLGAMHGGYVVSPINLLAQEQAVYALTFEGRFDVGNRLDYLRATVELALDRDDIGSQFKAYLAELARRERLG